MKTPVYKAAVAHDARMNRLTGYRSKHHPTAWAFLRVWRSTTKEEV